MIRYPFVWVRVNLYMGVPPGSIVWHFAVVAHPRLSTIIIHNSTRILEPCMQKATQLYSRVRVLKRASLLELELFSMLCSHEIFTDQSYHACIRSEKNPSIRSDACMTAYYARGQPASAWPLAGQPCKVDCDLHTIARAHNNTFFVRPIGTLCPCVAAVECVIMCTGVRRSCTVHDQNLCQNGTFSSSSNRPGLCNPFRIF